MENASFPDRILIPRVRRIFNGMKRHFRLGPTTDQRIFVPDHLPCGVIFYAFFEGENPPARMGGEDTPGESFRVKHAFGSGAFAL